MVKQEQARYSFKPLILNGTVRTLYALDYLWQFLYEYILTTNSWKHIKLEVLEFDAMEEPPSVVDVEVYDFDGPFELAASLGYVEINFLKHSPTELADMWIPLEGKLARSSQSKLHLRIFLDNNKGGDTVKEYLTKMEKEVGTKVLT